MHRNTWKSGERRICKIFSAYRTPLSGGASRHTRSDCLHTKLFIEIKHRKAYPQQNGWNKALGMAEKEGKIPLIVFNKYNHPDTLILCRLKDIEEINKFIINKKLE